MKSEDWKDVKIHDWVIFPTEDFGVYKAEIIEIDVKIEVYLPTFHYDYPYGYTKDSGVVRIRYLVNDVVHEDVENLSNLIAYNDAIFRELLRAYNEWQAYLSTANSYKETFLSLIQKRTAE